MPIRARWDIISDMTNADEDQANTLCKACGLCCTGHLFIWAKLRPSELDPAEALGMKVFRSDPTQRGFSQPCPLWQGQCTIYSDPRHPRICRAYLCKMLKKITRNDIELSHALNLVEQAKGMIRELEPFVSSSPGANFRERLVTRIEHPETFAVWKESESEFQPRAEALLSFYEEVFGVNDLIEKADET